MSIPSIQSSIQQMQSLAAQAAGKSEDRIAQPETSKANGPGFVDELHASIDRISQLQKTASESTKAFEMGDPRVSLNDVMVDKQQASLAFEMGVQVRNRLIQSYKEIMNMQV